MRILIKAVVLSILLAAHANAQVVASIAASATIDSVISKIKNSISELISEAEASATITGFSFATDANILIQNLDIMANQLSGKVFSDLNASQQSALANATLILSETDKSLAERISQVDSVVKTLGGEISRMPFVSKRPLVSSYNPAYILNNDASYEVTINGSLLNGKSSSLLFGTTLCKQVSSVEQTSKFVCPKEIFSTGNNEWVSGKLTIVKKAPWYTFWSKDKEYEYTIGVMAIQEELGEYELSVKETRKGNRRVNRSTPNGHRNDHCQGDRTMVWTYRPAPGCQIDVASINVTQSHSSNSTYNGVVNASGGGFQVRGVVRNNGSCGPFGVPKDGRGNLDVHARWTDVCPEAQEVELPKETGKISWLEEKPFDFPSTMTSFVLTVKQKDGKVKVIDRASSTDWFNTTYDPNAKLLVLKPKNVEDAFK